MWTTDFERFVAPARRAPQLWRLALGIGVIGLCWAVSSTLPFVALAGLEAGAGFDPMAFLGAMMAGLSPAGTLLVLFTFLGLAGGTVLAGLIHRRGPGTLVGRGQLLPFLLGLGAVVVTSTLGLLLPTDLTFQPNLQGRTWLLFLLPAILGLLLQTGAEELAFRGYLQTQLAARFRSPLVWLFLPGAVFGALHWNPGTFGENALVVVAATALIGWLAADLTRVSGGIGAAWGLHFGNNAGAILVIGLPGPLGGLSYWHHTTEPSDPSLGPLMLLQIGFLVLAWALMRLVLGRLRPRAAA